MKFKRLSAYGIIQLKRFFKELPGILLITLVLAGAIGLLAFVSFSARSRSDKFIRVNIGVVGDTEDSYMGVGIATISAIDSSKYEINLINMTEKEASEALKTGNISCYFVLPADLITGIANGSNPKIQLVTDAGKGIGGLAGEEIAWAISRIINESQTSVYTYQAIAAEAGIEDAYTTVADRYFLSQVGDILNRESGVELIEIGLGESVTMVGYFFCSLTVLFVMMWGITCSGIFCRKTKKRQQFYMPGDLVFAARFWQNSLHIFC